MPRAFRALPVIVAAARAGRRAGGAGSRVQHAAGDVRRRHPAASRSGRDARDAAGARASAPFGCRSPGRTSRRARSSRHKPRGFHGQDPAAYPASNWTRYDSIMRQAARTGSRSASWSRDRDRSGRSAGRAERRTARHLEALAGVTTARSCRPSARATAATTSPPARRGPAARALLVDLERAQLRRRPRATGDQQRHDRGRRGVVSQARRRRLERASARPTTATTRS